MTKSIENQIVALKQARAAAQTTGRARSPGRAAAPQRKQITVLFADVSGFTALSETLDAEDIAAVLIKGIPNGQ